MEFGSLKRPYPPEHLCVASGGHLIDETFIPAPDLAAWFEAIFVHEASPIFNPDHAHLQGAKIGALWTNVPNSRQGRSIVGQAELVPPQGAMGKWSKARVSQQIRGWFGEEPDFILTFYADYAAQVDDASFCALVEHELYHCGQELDAYGAPKFTQDGRPKYAMRGHDVEEFVGVVRRYGASASNAAPIMALANRPPEVAQAQIAGVCGTCLRLVA